jgi:hypothetical protein
MALRARLDPQQCPMISDPNSSWMAATQSVGKGRATPSAAGCLPVGYLWVALSKHQVIVQRDIRTALDSPSLKWRLPYTSSCKQEHCFCSLYPQCGVRSCPPLFSHCLQTPGYNMLPSELEFNFCLGWLLSIGKAAHASFAVVSLVSTTKSAHHSPFPSAPVSRMSRTCSWRARTAE